MSEELTQELLAYKESAQAEMKFQRERAEGLEARLVFLQARFDRITQAAYALTAKMGTKEMPVYAGQEEEFATLEMLLAERDYTPNKGE